MHSKKKCFFSEKLEETSKEVERLRKSIGAKEEQEKKHIGKTIQSILQF